MDGLADILGTVGEINMRIPRRGPLPHAWVLLVLAIGVASCASSGHRPPPEQGTPAERPPAPPPPGALPGKQHPPPSNQQQPPPGTQPATPPGKGGGGMVDRGRERTSSLPALTIAASVTAARPDHSEQAAAPVVRGVPQETPPPAPQETPPPPPSAPEPKPQEVPRGEQRQPSNADRTPTSRELRGPPAAPPEGAPPRPQESTPAPEGTVPHFEPFGHRWDVEPPPYEINKRRNPLNPYELNPLKGDFPIIGEDVFLNLEASNLTVVEARNLPIPSGITGPGAGNEDFFGDGENWFISNTTSLTVEIFKGQQAFKPVDWRLRFTGAVNVTNIELEELGIVNINVDDGTDRLTGDGALEEAFAEIHLVTWNDRYDFMSTEFGILNFRSDFRGHIFDDRNLGWRLFGNADDNKWQYNAVVFHLLEKDTNSELNTFDEREQTVFIANVYRFDFPIKGWNQSLSFHASLDDDSTYFDRNDFLRRPTPIGLASPHEVESYYVGWTSEGHFGRVNLSTAVYQVWGTDDDNPLAGREVDIDAQLVAVELSHDFDWFRIKAYGFYASGDENARDGRAEGFDGITENPNFAGGEFSYWQRQGIPLLGTFLTNRGSLFPDLKSLKFEGQSNFVNPGILVLGAGADFELTPTLRAIVGANYLRFMEMDTIETFLELENIDQDIGGEVYLGATWRPFLTNNVILTVGGSALQPGEGLQKIYETDETFWHVFAELTLTW